MVKFSHLFLNFVFVSIVYFFSESIFEVSTASELAEISAQNAALRLQLEEVAQSYGKSRRMELTDKTKKAIDVG